MCASIIRTIKRIMYREINGVNSSKNKKLINKEINAAVVRKIRN
jgi:hypothetical protein